MKVWIGAAIAAAVAIVPGTAIANGITLEGNGARAHSLWGAELGIGYRATFGGFSINPAVGAFLYKGDNDRYYMDEFSNGESRCRDSETGQFAADEKCNNIAAKAYGRVEATYQIPAAVELGAGVRISSDKARVYGTMALPLRPKLKFKGNLGDRYYALGMRVDF